jgi:hypothetical protein
MKSSKSSKSTKLPMLSCQKRAYYYGSESLDHVSIGLSMNAWIAVVELISLPLLVFLGEVYFHVTGFLLKEFVRR